MAGLKLTRQQFADFLKDHESIKQFEKLFSIVDPLAPDFVNEVLIVAENAGSRAQEALDALNRMANALELLALAPAYGTSLEDRIDPTQTQTVTEQNIEPIAVVPHQADDLTPPVQVGTLGQQQADRVSITGGAVAAQLKNNQTILLETTDTLSNGAAAAAGTLLNAPVVGNPTKWVAINDNGTTRYIPTW